MRAPCVNDEEAIGSLRHPDPVLLLPLRINSEGVITGRTDAKNTGRLKY